MRRWQWGGLLSALAMVAAAPALGADDAYLEALANEAADLSVDPATQQPADDVAAATGSSGQGSGIDWDARRQGLGDELPPGLDRPGFEEVLQINFIGSYVFYQRLPETSRTAVFDVYRESGDMAEVRARIQSELKAK